MFGINTFSRLRPCVLQPYVSSGMAMKILVVKVDCGNKPCSAGVHTSTVREAKDLLKKFINKSSNRKKTWYETPPRSQWSQPSPDQAHFLAQPRKRPENTHRLQVLNSLLFKALTDLLTSPELNSTILNYSVEITRVSLSPDFSSCRVYWKSSGASEPEVSMYSELSGGRVVRKTSDVSGQGQDDLIQKTLDRSSASIRYLITSRQIMGGLPSLVFIKDKQYATMAEVDRLLQIADFGPPEEDLDERQDGGEQSKMAISRQHVPTAKPVLFGVDHEALGRQIQDYKLHSKEAGSGREVPFPELTQTQLQVLDEYRRKQIMEKKKKKKPKQPRDNDITPKDFLLAQQGWGREAELDDDMDDHEEDAQLMELMAEEDKKA